MKNVRPHFGRDPSNETRKVYIQCGLALEKGTHSSDSRLNLQSSRQERSIQKSKGTVCGGTEHEQKPRNEDIAWHASLYFSPFSPFQIGSPFFLSSWVSRPLHFALSLLLPPLHFFLPFNSRPRPSFFSEHQRPPRLASRTLFRDRVLGASTPRGKTHPKEGRTVPLRPCAWPCTCTRLGPILIPRSFS